MRNKILVSLLIIVTLISVSFTYANNIRSKRILDIRDAEGQNEKLTKTERQIEIFPSLLFF